MLARSFAGQRGSAVVRVYGSPALGPDPGGWSRDRPTDRVDGDGVMQSQEKDDDHGLE